MCLVHGRTSTVSRLSEATASCAPPVLRTRYRGLSHPAPSSGGKTKKKPGSSFELSGFFYKFPLNRYSLFKYAVSNFLDLKAITESTVAGLASLPLFVRTVGSVLVQPVFFDSRLILFSASA